VNGPKSRRSVPHHLLGLIGAFVIAIACFVGSAFYEDFQFGVVTRSSHEVADNAMPSLFRLGVMRRETLEILFLLDEASEGSAAPLKELPVHWSTFDEAARAYALLPTFPGEAELQHAARADVEEMRSLSRAVEDLVTHWRFQDAQQVVVRDLQPTGRRVDSDLMHLLRLNHDQGTHAARTADALWGQARRTSFVLSAISVVLTAVLAFNAFRNARRYETSQRERADEMEAFAGRVAHDIRGPLAPVSLAIQSVQRTLDEKDARRMTLERGLRSLRNLESVITDLLTFARAGAGPDREGLAPLREVAANVVQDLEPQAKEDGARIAVEDLPTCGVACAPGVLTSILLNLVGNALKHMPKSALSKTVVLRGSRKRGSFVHVEVADTGQGLPPGDPSRLFEPFVRGNERQPGLGLGLATVRRLVEAHGGSVGVRPNEGQGAVFWFELPEKG
jgi:signal transduction histidine kinase